LADSLSQGAERIYKNQGLKASELEEKQK